MRRIVLATLSALILFSGQLHANPNSLKNWIFKKSNSETIISPIPSIEYKQKINLQPLVLSYMIENIEIVDMDDDSGGEGQIPADDLYAIWDNLTLNPYKISPDSILFNDSVYISLANFVFPVVKNYWITSEFGVRRSGFHYGIDLKVYRGDSIVSAMDGMVRIAKRVGNYGNLVGIRHNNGLESFYGHLDKILVKPDQQVKAGELIGYGGNTGRSTGSHLHFELRYLGQCINPRDLVYFDSLCAKSDTIMLSQANFNYQSKIASATASAGRMWTIRKGDSLSLIAKRTGTTVSRLCALNNITTKTVLRVGKKIYY